MSKPALALVLEVTNHGNDITDSPSVFGQHEQPQKTSDRKAVPLRQTPPESFIQQQCIRMKLQR